MAAEDADGDDLVPDEFFAPKIFLLMLKTAGKQPTPGKNGEATYKFTNIAHSPTFQRVWAQGVIVHRAEDGTAFTLDDSTGPPAEVVVPSTCDVASGGGLRVGAYVSVVATVSPRHSRDAARTRAAHALTAVKVRDLSDDVHREAHWNVEVLEGMKMLELSHHHRAGWVGPPIDS